MVMLIWTEESSWGASYSQGMTGNITWTHTLTHMWVTGIEFKREQDYMGGL